MSGIVCVINKGSYEYETMESMIELMCKAIRHYDKCMTDKYIYRGYGIGRVHLGILNPQPQPIFNEDNTLCIFMDGEVFGYEREKEYLQSKGHIFHVHNDAEFCLHLFEEYDTSFVEKLNGSFNIIILDKRGDKLLIANDRYGIRPLYVSQNDKRVLFAAEVKAILKDHSFKREVNDEAVAEFFAFGHLLGYKTLFKGIEVLPPASICFYQKGKLEIKEYWKFEFKDCGTHPESYYITNLSKLFKQAVKRRAKGDCRVGVLLSGGMDSRVIVGALPPTLHNIQTFTFIFPNMNQTPSIVKEIADMKGIPNKQYVVPSDFLVDHAEECVYLTDGMLSVVHFHMISILEKIREHSDILLNGWEPETTWKSTFLDMKIFRAQNDEELSRILFKKYNTIMSMEDCSHIFSEKYYKKIREVAFNSLRKEIQNLNDKHPANKSDSFVFLHRERRGFVLGLVYTRKVFEDREPFRDNELIDFALTIPPGLRVNRCIYPKVLKEITPELAKLQYARSGVRADAPPILHKVANICRCIVRKIGKILQRKFYKYPKIFHVDDYPDYGEWLRKNERLKNYIMKVLLDKRTLNRPYFNRKFIQKMLEDHIKYKRDYTQQIFALLTFELWHRMFIDDNREIL